MRNTFYFITLHYITLHYNTLQYITIQYITLQYITLHYNTIHYITIQYNTIHYNTIHYIKTYYITLIYYTNYLNLLIFIVGLEPFIANVVCYLDSEYQELQISFTQQTSAGFSICLCQPVMCEPWRVHVIQCALISTRFLEVTCTLLKYYSSQCYSVDCSRHLTFYSTMNLKSPTPTPSTKFEDTAP